MRQVSEEEYTRFANEQVLIADATLRDLIKLLAERKAAPLGTFVLATKLAALATFFDEFSTGDLVDSMLEAVEDEDVMRPILEQMVRAGLIDPASVAEDSTK